MSIIVSCDNKGCFKSQEALLDTETNEVICVECNKTIKNITTFTKSALKDLGQIKKEDKEKKSFALKCDQCNKTETPIMNKDKQILCGWCKKELNLSLPYKNMLKNNLSITK